MEQVLVLVTVTEQRLLLHGLQIPRHDFREVDAAKQPLGARQSLSGGDRVRVGEQPPDDYLQHLRFGTIYGEVAAQQVLQLLRCQTVEVRRTGEFAKVAAHEPVHTPSKLRQGIRFCDRSYVDAVLQVQLCL
jgi:hypothetical protein